MTENYGKEKYCKYCWACYHGKSCIATPESRSKMKLCEIAKARMSKATQKKPSKKKVAAEPSKSNEISAVKEYIKYISKRISFLKSFSGDIPSNEYKYYRALQDAIREWGKKHIIFYGYLHKKIEVEQAKNMFGISESTFYRLIRPQCKQLIEFIDKQEEILRKKYPFIPMADIFFEK